MRIVVATVFALTAGLLFTNAALLIFDLVIRPADGFRLAVTLIVAALYAAPGVLISAIGLTLNALLSSCDNVADPNRRHRLLARLAILLSIGAASLALILVISITGILQRMGEGVGVFG